MKGEKSNLRLFPKMLEMKIWITEVDSGPSSSTASPQTNVQPNNPMTYPNSKWTKDHPLNHIIGPLSRPVSTRLQLQEQALFCYYDAFLTSVEPKTYKEALTQACWIEAMQEEIHEFERLEEELSWKSSDDEEVGSQEEGNESNDDSDDGSDKDSEETVKSVAGKDGDDDDDEDNDDDDEEEETAKADEELKETGIGGDDVRE
nr:integrase, catalytic region, zinc finger, CCHC-type, peptidase aspartic, catalytic [Tanacetum cinerariifolium]